jgi:hypothetical protein
MITNRQYPTTAMSSPPAEIKTTKAKNGTVAKGIKIFL